MIIFLHGPDDYRRTQKKRELAAEFSKKRSAQGIGVFDLAEESGLVNLAEFLENQSLFEPAKFALLVNAFEVDAEALAKTIRPFLDRPMVTVLISEREKPAKALAFITKKPAIVQEFKNLPADLFARFALEEAKKNGLALDAPAARHLAAAYEGDSWGLATEMQKLSSLKQKMGNRDLDEFDFEIAPAYWPLLMGVRSPDLRNRLAALETLLAQGDPPPKIFNILASQWREKTREMAEYDFAVKSGKLEYDDALLALVL
jgi:DNA polymerase III delta subunit